MRELDWAADGKLRECWAREASLFAEIIHRVSGEAISPVDMIPERFRPVIEPVVKTESQLAHEGRQSWKLIDTHFQPGGNH